MQQYLKIALMFIVIFLCISSASVLVILSGASASACAFWRVFISSILLWAYSIFFKKSSRLVSYPDDRLLILSIVSGIFLGMHFLLWMKSLFLVQVAISTTIVTTYPLFNLLIDAVVFKERVSVIQIIFMIIGFIGVVLFIHPRILGSQSILGVILAFIASIVVALYFSIGRYVRRKIGLLDYLKIVYLSASVTILLYALITRENIINYGLRSYLFFLALALIPMLGGHTLMNYLLRYLRTSIVTSISLTEPIGASILAYYILGQELSIEKILIMMMVIISVAIAMYQGIKEIES
ncbi:MAG: EamA/RhaT family transporter [Thermoprotei archaeon]|nr:MAG: EamA/RhaT family transporter [Thermoprotei archaeon]